MIGGKVLETLIVKDRVWINTGDFSSETGKLRESCAIYVDDTPEARSISEGDIVWWQGRTAYWTAKNRHGQRIGKVETPLKRRGYSGVNKPQVT